MHVNKPMITDVLKGELGFGGFVVTDYNGCFQAGVSGVSASLNACLSAGVDMFMIFGGNTGAPQPFGTTSVLSYLRQLIQDNIVPASRLDDAVRRILAVKCEMGLFDTTGVIDTAATGRVGSAAHRMVARQAVQKSLVVLKNDNSVLPLSKRATSSPARPAFGPRWRRRSARRGSCIRSMARARQARRWAWP
jgi:beta-glucosidase